MGIRITHEAVRAAEVASTCVTCRNSLEVIVFVAKKAGFLLLLRFASGLNRIVAAKLARRLFFSNGDTVCGVKLLGRVNFDRRLHQGGALHKFRVADLERLSPLVALALSSVRTLEGTRVRGYIAVCMVVCLSGTLFVVRAATHASWWNWLAGSLSNKDSKAICT